MRSGAILLRFIVVKKLFSRMKKDRRTENRPEAIPHGVERRGDAGTLPSDARSSDVRVSVQIPSGPLRGERESHDPRARAPLPIVERIGADTRFTGRGIVTAFLDSGFFAHADLTTPHSRIRGYYDLIHDKH